MRATQAKKMHSNKAPKGGKPKEQSSPYPKKAKKLSEVVEDFEQEEATPDQLAKIKEIAGKAVSLEHQIADLEAALTSLKEERDGILNKQLPSLMDSAGMANFELVDGSEITIKDFINGSLPNAEKKPEERKAAIAWLMKNGGKGIIKTKFVSEFGVGQEKLVAAFEKLITKAKFAAKKDVVVHPQTLYAFVRELLEDGKKVPIEKLGLYAGRAAKINLSDKAATKAEQERVKPRKRS